MSILDSNPFEIMERCLWAAIEVQPELSALVRPANRIKYHTLGSTQQGDSPEKDSTTAADLPQLTIIPAGGTINQPGTGVSSSSISIVQRFTFALATDEPRTSLSVRRINAVKWALMLALLRMHTTEPIPGANIIRSVTPQGYQDEEGVDPVPGWTCVLSVSVVAVISKQEAGIQ